MPQDSNSFNAKHEAKLLFRRSMHFFSGTMLSRVFGMIRDIVTASTFGATGPASLFTVAFRFTNLPRRLFGEGALQNIVITRYEQIKKDHSDPKDLMRKIPQFYLDSSFSWALLVAGFIGLLLYPLIFLIESDAIASFLDHHQYCQKTTLLTITHYCKLMLPGLWFICMCAQNDAFIKSERHFLFVSGAPAIFNCVWVLSTLTIASFALSKENGLTLLSIAIVLAFAVQWSASQTRVVVLMKKVYPGSLSLRPRLFSDQVKDLFTPLLLGIIGVGALQINALLDSIFALSSEMAGPSFLWYSFRIIQAPVSLVGIAIATASLPPLAKAIKNSQMQEAGKLFSMSYTSLSAAILMASSALFVVGLPLLRLMFERGEFAPYQSVRTTQCLWAYTAGLTPHCLIFLYQNALFSINRVKNVTRASIASVVVNLLLNSLFVSYFKLGTYSVALSTSLATFTQLLIIKKDLRGLLPEMMPKIDLLSFAKQLVLLLASWTFALALYSYLYQVPASCFLSSDPSLCIKNLTFFQHIYFLMQSLVLWLIFYLASARLLNIPLPVVKKAP